MTVNELIADLQEKVARNPKVGEYTARVHTTIAQSNSDGDRFGENAECKVSGSSTDHQNREYAVWGSSDKDTGWGNPRQYKTKY